MSALHNPRPASIAGDGRVSFWGAVYPECPLQQDDCNEAQCIATDGEVVGEYFDFDAACSESLENNPYQACSPPDARAQSQHEGTVDAAPEVNRDPQTQETADSIQEHVEHLCSRYFSSDLWDFEPSLTDNDDLMRHLTSPVNDEDRQIHTRMEAIRNGELDERWEIDTGTAEYIQSIITPQIIDIYGDHPPSVRHSLKVEHPLLMTDHDLDMLEVFRRNASHVTSDGMVPYNLDDEKDEGLRFPEEYNLFRRKLEEDTMALKLVVDKAAAEMIQDVITPWASEGWASLRPSRVSKLYQLWHSSPLIPPLSPMSSPPVRSPCLEEPAQTFSPADVWEKELSEFGDDVLDQDGFDFETEVNIASTPGSKLTVVTRPLVDDSPPPQQRVNKRLRDVMSSPTLLVEQSPAKKARIVAFSDELDVKVSQTPNILSQSTSGNGEGQARPPSRIEPSNTDDSHGLAHEQKCELDVTLRVPTSSLDARTTSSPNAIEAGTQEQPDESVDLRCVRASLRPGELKWSGLSKVEQSLSWVAFPSRLGKIRLEGDFDDGSLSRYLADLDLDGKIPLDLFLWKEPGLRILDTAYCDDDDLQSVVPELEDSGSQSSASTIPRPQAGFTRAGDVHTNQTPARPELDWASMTAKFQQRRRREGTEASSCASKGIFAQGLGRFLQLQGRPDMVVPGHSPSDDQKPLEQTSDGTAQNLSFASEQKQSQSPRITLPFLDRPERAFSIVTSLPVRDDWQLLRKLGEILPELDLIERCRSIAHDAKATPNVEADFTLSAETGIIITTLQKLKQKALPGQKASFIGIRKRIALVAPRYERLIILISEGASQSHSLDARDTEAITSLICHNKNLSTDTQTYYVQGGQQELAHWIAVMICRFSGARIGNEKSPALLHDETLWEQWLRSAGMNAYAAQAVLSCLRSPEQLESLPNAGVVNDDETPAIDHGLDSTSANARSGGGAAVEITLQGAALARREGLEGLAAFVTMSHAQRLQRFARVMGGGERVLRRVNAMLARQGWCSSATAASLQQER